MINTPHPSSTPRDARTVSDLNVAPGRIGSVADWATRSETLLAEAKPELWSKLDSIPCLAWRARPGGFAEYLNKRWLDFTGVSLQQAVGWQWQAAIHPDDLSGLNGAWRQILGSGTSGKIEARMRRFDGTYRWFMFRIEPFHDATGAIVAWYGTNTDIEERKVARCARHHSRLGSWIGASGPRSPLRRILHHQVEWIGAVDLPSDNRRALRTLVGQLLLLALRPSKLARRGTEHVTEMTR
jgi:PAS domain S-box-containing protein